jgi:hypothetical protein
MDRENIVEQLRQARSRIEHAIAALEDRHSHVTVKRTPAKKAKRGGGITAAGRKNLSLMMKARWAARRAAGKSTKKK